MRTTITFFQSPRIALLYVVISSNLVRYGIIASPPNFKISPGMPTGPTDFFLAIADNRFLIMLILMVKGYVILLIEFADYYVRNWLETHNKNLWSWSFLLDL